MEILKQGEGVVVTDVEIEIVGFLAEGLRAKDIASKRERSLKTVEVQLNNLKKKTGCRSLPHLVATFLRSGIIN